MDDEEVVDKHESYGMVGMNCVSGETRLFGSQALHHSFLRFEVRHAEMRRQHSYDRPVADSMPVIEFDISHAALAQLITNPGRGYGVPCTLRRVNGKQMEEPPDPTPITSKFQGDLKKTMASAMSTLEGLANQLREVTLPGNKPLGKKELSTLLGGIRHAIMQVKDNIPYVEDSFNEHMEDEVNKAITELEGARGHMISQLGLEAFAATAEQQLPEFTLMKAPLLGDGKKK